MGMPSINGDISTMDSEERPRIENKNKKFLYARAVHATHMIQHHMHEISERQRVNRILSKVQKSFRSCTHVNRC